MEDKLTHKQNRFAQLVVEGNTYVDAYRKSYDVGKNTSVNTLYVKSSQMMDMDKIRIRVQELQKENTARNQASLDDVINELSKWLRFNLKSIFNEDGTMKQIHEMTEDEAACIASYEVLETTKSGEVVGVLRKVKLIDKLGSADKLLRKMGAYIENRNVKFDKDNLEHLRDILDEIL